MLREFLSRVELTELPVLGMCIFVAVFLGALFRVLGRGRSAEYRRMAALPLEDERQRSES